MNRAACSGAPATRRIRITMLRRTPMVMDIRMATAIPMTTIMTTEGGGSDRPLPELLYLLQFADSALPVGGFSFSNGLETAIQQGIVDGPATLRTYTETSMWQAATSDGVAV